MRQYVIRWLAVALMVCLGSGQSRAGVLCIGEDGHAQVEFVSVGPGSEPMCPAVGLRETAAGGEPLCGDCVDVPLPFGYGSGEAPRLEGRKAVSASAVVAAVVSEGFAAKAGETEAGALRPGLAVDKGPPGLSHLSAIVLLN